MARNVIGFFIALYCLSTGSVDAKEPGNDMSTLRLIHVFFRHGARTPELKDTYPRDRYGADVFAPMGYGQLTNLGQWQAYSLGVRLRTRYSRFLGATYFPEAVYALSTDYDRTKASLLAALAGLYPPTGVQIWNDKLLWLPIPILYKEAKLDFFLRRPNHYCPAYLEELNHQLQTDEEHLKLLKGLRTTFEFITEHTGMQVDTSQKGFGLYHTLRAEHAMNLTLPDWTKGGIYPDTLSKLAVEQCRIENSTPKLKRLNGGRSLQRVIQNMQARSEGRLQPLTRKIYLYSGHENNVVNLLSALGFFEGPEQHFPDYSSAFIFELHEEKEAYAVKMFYLRDVQQPIEEKKLKDCPALCPLQDFIRLTKDVVPQNYTAECHSVAQLD